MNLNTISLPNKARPTITTTTTKKYDLLDPIGLEEMQGVRELESRKQVIQLEVDVSHKDNI
jgi:hypothetical protein